MKIEPPADIRAWGLATFQMFTALIDAGFTADQALKLLAFWMSSVGTDEEEK